MPPATRTSPVSGRYPPVMTVTARPPQASRHRTWPAVAAAAGAATLYGINGSISKVTLAAGLSSPRLSELRVTGALLCLLAVAAGRSKRGGRPRGRELAGLITYGLVGVAVVQTLYFVAIQRLHVGVALLIEFTAPVFIVLWVRFGRGQRVSRAAWAGLVLSLLGLALVAQLGTGSRLDVVGVLAGLGAAVGLSVYYLLGEALVVRRDVVSVTTWAFAAAAAFWAVVTPWTSFPWRVLTKNVSLTGRLEGWHAPVWALGAATVVVGTVLPYLLVLSALRSLPAGRAGILGMLEPVVATVTAWGWLGEALSPMQLVGGTVLLLGVTLAQLSRTTRPVQGLDAAP